MSPSSDLQDLALRTLDWARRQDAGLQTEIYLSRSEERGVEMREGRLDNMQHGSAEGAGLRVLGAGRMGFACAGGISSAGLQDLFRRAREQLGHLEVDDCRALPGPCAAGPDQALADSLWDEELFRAPLEDSVRRLSDCGARALQSDRRLSAMLRAGYGESRGEVVVANTLGVMTHERGSTVSVGFSAIAHDNGEVQVGSAYQSACKASGLDFCRVAAEAAERTARLLGGRKLPGARRSVLFDPWAAGDVLELVAGLLCADQVQRGKSLLAGCLGKKVGSDLATFRDDPRRPGGLGSCLHDDEGLPTSAKTMVEAGVVKDYFYDTYTGRKDKRAGNASAGRGSYKGLPGPTHSNFYLEPGVLSRDALIKSTPDGLLVLDIMGMHMADPISGEFSVGVSGLAVSGGSLGTPVKKAMIAGNLKDLLAGIDAKADDLTFYGSLGSPTFRVAGMSVA